MNEKQEKRIKEIWNEVYNQTPDFQDVDRDEVFDELKDTFKKTNLAVLEDGELEEIIIALVRKKKI